MNMTFYLSKIVLFIKFILFPQRIKLKVNAAEGAAIQIGLKNNGLPLVIAFSGLGQEFNFVKTLKDYPVNAIFVRDLKNHWYVNGLRDVGNTVDEVCLHLTKQIASLNPSKVIIMGSSAGGFAALLYGSLLKADAILAFSPQTFMTKAKCLFHLDYRWLDRVIEIYASPTVERRHLDLRRIVEQHVKEIIVVYDKSHRLDRLHAERLKAPQLFFEPKNDGGHNLVRTLRNTGELDFLIRRVLN
jgi:hypothetical protein